MWCCQSVILWQGWKRSHWLNSPKNHGSGFPGTSILVSIRGDDALPASGFHPRIEHIVPQAQAIVSLVAAHTGISVVTQWAEHGLPQPGVVYRPLAGIIYQAELHVLWRIQETSPLVHDFLQVMRTVQKELDLPDRHDG